MKEFLPGKEMYPDTQTKYIDQTVTKSNDNNYKDHEYECHNSSKKNKPNTINR